MKPVVLTFLVNYSKVPQDLRGVILRLDLVIGLGDLARLIDQERHAVDTVELTSHELFQAPNPKGLGQGMLLVHEQREGEVELVPKLLVGFGVVSRHSKDLDFLPLEAIP